MIIYQKVSLDLKYKFIVNIYDARSIFIEWIYCSEIASNANFYKNLRKHIYLEVEFSDIKIKYSGKYGIAYCEQRVTYTGIQLSNMLYPLLFDIIEKKFTK